MLRSPRGEWVPLDASQHKDAAERYLLDAVADLFRRASGKFQFMDEPGPKGYDPDLVRAGAALDPNAVAFEGARRQDEWPRIKRQIRSFEDVFVRKAAPGESQELDLSPDAGRLLSLLDGGRSLDDCMAFLPCGEFGTGAALIELIEHRLVELATADELLEQARAAEKANDGARAEQLYARALRLEPNNDKVQDGYIALLERTGRTKEAASQRMQRAAAKALDRDLPGAIAEYKKAAVALPADTAALERVVELERERGDTVAEREAEKRLAERFLMLRLPDKARDIFQGLVTRFPDDLDLRGRLADILGMLGQKKEAAAAWKSIAKIKDKAMDEAGALAAFERASQLNPEDGDARAGAQSIRTGRRPIQNARSKRVRRAAIALFFGLAAGAGIGREVLAFRALDAVVAKVLDPEHGAADRGARAAALRKVGADHPYTLVALEAERLARAADPGKK